MKNDNQIIKCNVYDCTHCNIECDCCNLNKIKVTNCNNKENKESTMCNSYDNRK